jgi:hypothetical protein
VWVFCVGRDEREFYRYHGVTKGVVLLCCCAVVLLCCLFSFSCVAVKGLITGCKECLEWKGN